jgi:hypothetical protein
MAVGERAKHSSSVVEVPQRNMPYYNGLPTR